MTAVGETRRAPLVAAVERRCRDALYRDRIWWMDYVRLRVVAVRESSP